MLHHVWWWRCQESRRNPIHNQHSDDFAKGIGTIVSCFRRRLPQPIHLHSGQYLGHENLGKYPSIQKKRMAGTKGTTITQTILPHSTRTCIYGSNANARQGCSFAHGFWKRCHGQGNGKGLSFLDATFGLQKCEIRKRISGLETTPNKIIPAEQEK